MDVADATSTQKLVLIFVLNAKKHGTIINYEMCKRGLIASFAYILYYNIIIILYNYEREHQSGNSCEDAA